MRIDEPCSLCAPKPGVAWIAECKETRCALDGLRLSSGLVLCSWVDLRCLPQSHRCQNRDDFSTDTMWQWSASVWMRRWDFGSGARNPGACLHPRHHSLSKQETHAQVPQSGMTKSLLPQLFVR